MAKKTRKLPKISLKRKKKISPKIPWWAFRRRLKQKKEAEAEAEEGTAPRITNDTVAEHREEVLSGAKRFMYPLQQSRHKVVIISSAIIVLVVLLFFSMSGLLIYRYKSTSDFAYRVSQVLPFPAAKVNGNWVTYEDYLFEVKNSLFYYRNHGQEDVDIDSDAGQDLVNEVKHQAFEKVKLDSIAKALADENGITVSGEEVDAQIELIRSQGGVGESEQVLEDILADFYDWDVNDLRHSIYLQLIRQKLPGVLDTETVEAADRALAELNDGKKFGEVAEKFSDDLLTRENDGVIGLISRTNTDLPVEFVEVAFNLAEGEVSGLVESSFGLHIIKNNKSNGDQIEVAHILFQYFDVVEFLKSKLAEADVSDFISL